MRSRLAPVTCIWVQIKDYKYMRGEVEALIAMTAALSSVMPDN